MLHSNTNHLKMFDPSERRRFPRSPYWHNALDSAFNLKIDKLTKCSFIYLPIFEWRNNSRESSLKHAPFMISHPHSVKP